MPYHPSTGYEIRHFNGNPSGRWPTFQVRQLNLHPATEWVSLQIFAHMIFMLLA